MLLTLCSGSDTVFATPFRKQLLAALSVTLISLSHGIGLGWISPMLPKLQSAESPLAMAVSVEQASWIGALICAGGITGNLIYGSLLDRIGRKLSLYSLAVPHLCCWALLYFASRVEHLYAARICGGITGGGIYVVLPIFISEIADNTVRGRLSSLLSLSINAGILVGFVVGAHLPYHLVPLLVTALPLLYLLLAALLPETPRQLLRGGHLAAAEASLRFYTNSKAPTKAHAQHFDARFAELRHNMAAQMQSSERIQMDDYLNKRALKALLTGMLLMMLNSCSGLFVLINYMSSIFIQVKTELHPDTNTIITGVVQLAGAYTATLLVDRYGRKVLLIVSSVGMGLGLAVFGMYAFFAEETDADLSPYSSWLPLLIMSGIIFIGNIGIASVSIVVLVEVMPPKIRSQASAFCLLLLSVFAFIMLKVFPILLQVVGMAATMWFCASVCAFGLFYIAIFVPETKNKSLDEVAQ